MPDPVARDDLLQNWVSPASPPAAGEERVYKPDTSSDLPPAKALIGFELRDDGTFVATGTGAADASEVVGSGTWSYQNGILTLGPSQKFKIRQVETGSGSAPDLEAVQLPAG
jgi:hypothetical protein